MYYTVLQSGDYKKIYLVRIDEKDIDVPSEFIMGFPYLVKLSGYSTGVYEKHKIWADIQNAPKILLYYVIDLDYKSEIKRKIKENLSNIEEELYHFKVFRAKEIVQRLENTGIPAERIKFANGKTSFHILIKPTKPIPFNEITYPIIEYEQSQYESIIKSIVEDLSFEIDPWKLNKATYREELDITIQINPDHLAKIFQEYLETSELEEKDPAKLQNILPQMIEEFRNNPNHEGVAIFGGQHHSFILLLAGELAKSGFSLEEAISIYEQHFAPYDNPKDYRERLAIIRHTYNRYGNRQPILSWRNLRPEWKLSRAQKIEIGLSATEILARGVKSFIYPYKGKMVEKRVIKNTIKGKPYLTYTHREISFPYIVEPIKFENDKIHFILYNQNEYYTIVSPFPSTSENIKGFEQSISHLPLTRHQTKSLRVIIENFIAFRDYWGKRIEVRNIFNEREGLQENDTGYCNVFDLWKNSKAFRLAISLAIAKYQNPELPNPVLWLWGDTGTGKSRTLSQIAQAFAEKPLLNATYNALETYASTLHNKPLIIDDLAVFRDKIRDIFDLVFTAHAGIGKARRAAVAGSQRIDVRGLSASVFMASEIEPQTLLQLKQGEIGVLRRVFLLQMEPVEYPSDLTDGKGWALFLKKITPTDEDQKILKRYQIKEWHARAFLPYIVAIYRVFNELFDTDFDPYAEFCEITQHLQSLISLSIQKSIGDFVKSQLLENTKDFFLIHDPIENKLVLPEIALSLLAPKVGISAKTLKKTLDENYPKCTIAHPKFKSLMLRGWNLIKILEIPVENEDEGDIEL
ncbi:MAG: hypothetical protein QXX84_07005 [Sulfolobales archaeon]